MRLHKSLKYKNHIILIYQQDGYYRSLICDNKDNCDNLIALYVTEYEAITYAKKRIDVNK